MEYSTTIAAGLVSCHRSCIGAAVNRGSIVTVKVSQGPKPIELPALAVSPSTP